MKRILTSIRIIMSTRTRKEKMKTLIKGTYKGEILLPKPVKAGKDFSVVRANGVRILIPAAKTNDPKFAPKIKLK